MSDAGGFGAAGLAFLPPRLQRVMAAADAAERAAERRAGRERAERAEEWRNRNAAMYRSAAEARGEDLMTIEVMTRQDLGRSVGEILADVAAAADREDARAARRAAKTGVDHVFIGETVIRSAKPLTMRQRAVKKLTDAFAAGHPEADVIDRAMFRSEAERAVARDFGRWAR
jgi:hypothetical protein